MTYGAVNVLAFDDYVLQAMHNHADDFKTVFDRFTLKDTGALINSGSVICTQDGLDIDYDVDYFDYVFHRNVRNPTTPGTTGYWDKAAIESVAYARLMAKIKEEACEISRRELIRYLE